MIRLGIGLNNFIFYRGNPIASGGGGSVWILAAGVWNDSGEWDDSAIWID